MAILDVDTVGSPGWWMVRLSRQLQANTPRLKLLEDYWAGRPPIIAGSSDAQSTFWEFQKMCGTNFAALIASAPCDQIELRSVVTGAQSDDEGDSAVWQFVTATGFDLALGSAALTAQKFGWSYLSTAPAEDGETFPMVTAEDPRMMVHEPHPTNPNKIRAAFKLFYDSAAQCDVATLWLPGETWVATRPRETSIVMPRSDAVVGVPEVVPVNFDATSFTMQPMRDADSDPDGFYSESDDSGDIPVELVEAPGGVGAYELHLSLLDRINRGILNRLVIATLQAFKQRAIVSSSPDVPALDEEDEDGNPIDWNNMFTSDPGALWILPQGRSMWESGQVDLTGILSSVKDDVLHLAAVSGTPMSMFTPDAVTSSAEGVQLTREALTNKVRRFQVTLGRAGARSVARAYRMMGDSVRGDASKTQLVFFPPVRYSLAEQGQAASQAGDSLTWEQKQEIIWQRTPQEIAVARTQRMQDLMFQQVAAQASSPQTSPQVTQPPQAPQLMAASDDNADA